MDFPLPTFFRHSVYLFLLLLLHLDLSLFPIREARCRRRRRIPPFQFVSTQVMRRRRGGILPFRLSYQESSNKFQTNILCVKSGAAREAEVRRAERRASPPAPYLRMKNALLPSCFPPLPLCGTLSLPPSHPRPGGTRWEDEESLFDVLHFVVVAVAEGFGGRE